MIIETLNLKKVYNNIVVVDNISLNINEGKIIGLLGVNGAGKTTIMRMLTRVILPDSGGILFMGEELSKKNLRQIGYMPEERGLYKNMKVKEYLTYISELYSLGNTTSFIDTWLEKLSLTAVSNNYINDLSKGMSQKVQFISTIMHKPKLLILDEPFSGLDPVSSELIESELKILRDKDNITILLSTHRVEQVESLCDEIIMLHKGKLLISGEINEIKNYFSKDIYSLKMNKLSMSHFSNYEIVEKYDNEIHVKLSTIEDKKSFTNSIAESGNTLLSFNAVTPTIKSIFINSIK